MNSFKKSISANCAAVLALQHKSDSTDRSHVDIRGVHLEILYIQARLISCQDHIIYILYYDTYSSFYESRLYSLYIYPQYSICTTVYIFIYHSTYDIIYVCIFTSLSDLCYFITIIYYKHNLKIYYFTHPIASLSPPSLPFYR